MGKYTQCLKIATVKLPTKLSSSKPHDDFNFLRED